MITVPALAGLPHGFFTRQGGVSGGIFASRNCGPGSGDDMAQVEQNRALCMADLGHPADALVTVYQRHTATVVVVDQPFSPDQIPVADAMVTRQKGLVLGILTADCTPVLFADRKAGVVGAAHAGWRGAVFGILDETVAALQGLGAKADHLVAIIGPTIGPASYEVGPEFPDPILAERPDNSRFFTPSARAEHFMFDLPGYVAAKLALLGVGTVVDTGLDTRALPEHFFSYRRMTLAGETQYGRQLSAIGLGA